MDSAKLAHALPPRSPFPDDFIAEVLSCKDRIQQQLEIMRGRRVAMQVERTGGFENAAEFDQARGHHGEVGHHVVGAQERVECLHDLADFAGLENQLLIDLLAFLVPLQVSSKARIWLAASVPSFSWKKAL